MKFSKDNQHLLTSYRLIYGQNVHVSLATVFTSKAVKSVYTIVHGIVSKTIQVESTLEATFRVCKYYRNMVFN